MTDPLALTLREIREIKERGMHDITPAQLAEMREAASLKCSMRPGGLVRGSEDQPCDLTWDDVDALRSLSDFNLSDREADDGDGHYDVWASDELTATIKRIAEIADRIAAHLSPRS